MHPDGHDRPGFVGGVVPGGATPVDDIVVAVEDPVREPQTLRCAI